MKIDLLLKDVKVFNSYYKKFVEGNVAILDGKVLYIDKKKNESFEAKEEMNCEGKYLIPGFVDIHMHIESTMTTPEPFCETLAKYGVTTIISEPHEIANVMGVAGINAMIEAGKESKVDVFYAIPSSVPSTNEKLETTGAKISFDDMVELSNMEDVVCVGEVMNYTGVISDPELEICKFIKHLKATKPNYVIEGHCPSLLDLDLAKFLFLGINGDHTEHNFEEVRQRFENGMFVEFQYKMLREELIEYVKENNLFEHMCFVTDDVMADDFIWKGHLNVIVKRAIELGMSVEEAIYCATFTPSRRMNLTDRGAIAPGKIADMILLDNLEDFNITNTFKDGKVIYNSSEEFKFTKPKYVFDKSFYESVKLDKLTKDNFKIELPIKDGTLTCRVMEVRNGGTLTKEVFRDIEVKDGNLVLEGTDCLLVSVFERYGKNGGVGFGLMTGDAIKDGAVATTYAHDHHNLFVTGKRIEDMVIAANKVIEYQGGFVVVKDEKIIADLQLNVGGILSDESMDVIGEKVKNVKAGLIELGYNHYNPIMSLCTLSLPVSPELKITDKGLINVRESKVVTLWV